MVAVNVPVELVVTLAGLVVIAAPSSFTLTAVLAAKPLPVIVTILPTEALVGESVILSAAEPSVENVAVPSLPEASVTITR
jgi:hypothetical protein